METVAGERFSHWLCVELLESCCSPRRSVDNHRPHGTSWGLSGGLRGWLRLLVPQTRPTGPKDVPECEIGRAKPRKVPGKPGRVSHSARNNTLRGEFLRDSQARTKHGELQKALHSLGYCLVYILPHSFLLILPHGCWPWPYHFFGRWNVSGPARSRGFKVWLGLVSCGLPQEDLC